MWGGPEENPRSSPEPETCPTGAGPSAGEPVVGDEGVDICALGPMRPNPTTPLGGQGVVPNEFGLPNGFGGRFVGLR